MHQWLLALVPVEAFCSWAQGSYLVLQPLLPKPSSGWHACMCRRCCQCSLLKLSYKQKINFYKPAPVLFWISNFIYYFYHDLVELRQVSLLLPRSWTLGTQQSVVLWHHHFVSHHGGGCDWSEWQLWCVWKEIDLIISSIRKCNWHCSDISWDFPNVSRSGSPAVHPLVGIGCHLGCILVENWVKSLKAACLFQGWGLLDALDKGIIPQYLAQLVINHGACNQTMRDQILYFTGLAIG